MNTDNFDRDFRITGDAQPEDVDDQEAVDRAVTAFQLFRELGWESDSIFIEGYNNSIVAAIRQNSQVVFSVALCTPRKDFNKFKTDVVTTIETAPKEELVALWNKKSGEIATVIGQMFNRGVVPPKVLNVLEDLKMNEMVSKPSKYLA